MPWQFEAFTAISVLFLLGTAWAHLAVKLDRMERRGVHNSLCLKRVRLRLAWVERWLPPPPGGE